MKVNILVCVKQVPKEEDLKLDPVTKTLIRSQGTGVISEYDKYAMELAARLKAENGGKVTAVTMGPPSSMEVLRYCMAVGADDVYLLSDRALGGADAYATVNALAAAKIVRPKLYIACGISGALQHMVGVEKAECTTSHRPCWQRTTCCAAMVLRSGRSARRKPRVRSA